MPFPSSVSVVLLALGATLATGCYATVSPGAPPEGPPGPPPPTTITAAPGAEPVPDEVVYEAPPPQIETYPVVVYAGAPHYYVNGRWYTRNTRGWGYYRREPPQLVSRRPPPRREERREEHREEHHEERREERH